MDLNLHTNSNETEQAFESLKSWVDFYSKKSWINFVIDEKLDAPAAVPDNSINNDLTIILNPKLLKQKFKLTDEQLLFVLFHEIEHIIEDSKLKSSPKWQKVANERKKRLTEAKHLAKAIHTLENIVRDVYVNNEVSKKAPVLWQAKRSNYKDHFFKESDFLNMPEVWKDWKETWKTSPLPKHLQFAYTILREAMLPDEKCNIDPEIRKIVNRFKRAWVINKASSWSLSDRLESIWKYLEPTYKRFLEEDIKNNKDSNQNNNWDSSNSGDSDPSNSNWTPNNNWEWNSNEANSNNGNESEWNSKDGVMDKVKKAIKKLTWDQKEQDNNDSNKKESDDEKKQENENIEPKNPFDDIYEDYWELPHILDDNLEKEDMKKVKEKIKQKVEWSKPKSREQLELEKRAENMWVDPDNDKEIENTVKRLRDYDKFLERLKWLKDTETWNSVMEEIYNLFQNIRAKRLKPKMKSRWPVDMEHWVRLDTWSIATWIAQVKSWETNPVMFKEDIKHVKENLLVWDFDLTIVADWTWSMWWEKNRQQKIAFLLILEALKILHDKFEINKSKLKQPINFETEWFIFGSNSRCIKEKSSDFKDSEKLAVYSSLDEDDWPDNNEWLLLEKMYKDFSNNTSESEKKEIKEWKTKKIIIVLSDWWQDVAEYERKLRENIKNFRNDWVLVYAVGITNDWSPVVDLFAWENKSLWFWQVCEKAEDLSRTLKDLLIDHIKNV